MALTVKQTPPGVIKTIFVGGGTPTVLKPDEMAYFLKSVRTHFPQWDENIEFSMEANPGTTDKDKLTVMKEGGVNRVSFGVQAFQNELLSGIGRIHNVDDVYRSLENARSVGLDNLSVDLMFGLPNQTVDMLRESIQRALELNLPHYSIYSLKVEENTLFHTLFNKNKLPLPSEEDELEMYLLLMSTMTGEGEGGTRGGPAGDLYIVIRVKSHEVSIWEDPIATIVFTLATDGLLAFSRSGPVAIEAGQKFYQVTSKEAAKEIMASGVLTGSKQEAGQIFVWTTKPTLAQAKNSGARSLETVIEFEIPSGALAVDRTVAENLQRYARAARGPLKIINVKEIPFKK